MKALLLSIMLVALYLIYGSSVVSAAAITNTDTNPGQVKTTRTNDGTLFLTTSVNGETPQAQSRTANAAKNTTNTATNQRITGEAVTQPTGFANDLGSYINSVLGIVIVVSLLLVFFNFIQAGFQWITSGGDKGKTEEARNRIVNAVVGILIVSSSFAVLSFVAYILGFDSVNDALSDIERINP